MFHYSELREVQVEITSNCQASCPFCARNLRGGKINPRITVRDWSIDDFKRIFSQKDLKHLKHINFCGNYGDPVTNSDLPLMLEYARSINKQLQFTVHSNASMRTKEWWKDIAKYFTGNSEVRFALDGLADTHSRHRIGTDFNKVLENAIAFIQAGGNATWFFIRFKHNQHQVKEARKLSAEYGFKNFMLIDSQRFDGEDKRVVLNKGGMVVDELEPSTESVIEFIPKFTSVKDIEDLAKSVEICCEAVETTGLYIDYNGHLFPCCYTASAFYRDIDPYNSLLTKFVPILRNQVVEAINELGGINSINCKIHSIEEIVSNPKWHTVWQDRWNNAKLFVCLRECGRMNFSKRTDQLIEYTRQT